MRLEDSRVPVILFKVLVTNPNSHWMTRIKQDLIQLNLQSFWSFIINNDGIVDLEKIQLDLNKLSYDNDLLRIQQS